jgi:glutathione S-transferase
MSYIVYGVSLSPFVRKVCAFLEEKGVAYEQQIVFPGGSMPDEFKEISPLGKIPAFRDGDRGFSDSSVICAYIDRKHPTPVLYPEDDFEYARALWFEEYADTALLNSITPAFLERVVKPAMLKKETDEAVVRSAIEEKQPPVFDYLEGQIEGKEYFVGDAFSLADLSIATMFPTLEYAEVELDAKRWPNLKRAVDATLARTSFQGLLSNDRNLLAGMRQ